MAKIKKEKFYITTPVYYANAKPHIGHAYTTIGADVAVRFRKLLGKKTFFLTGLDEHGAKIAQKAEMENKSPQELVDSLVDDFKNLWQRLDIEYDVFSRTTDLGHKKFVQEAVQKLYDKGIIYKGEYEGKYCVGCEQFKNESDLVDGKCPDHNVEPEIMKEESYLMKIGEQQNWLIESIERDDFLIRPEKYKKEMLSFLKNNKLEDLAISRKNVSWGIPLPFDNTHTIYVWFDAFLSYVTGLKIPSKSNDNNFAKFWPADVNLIGKDILRVHSTIWPIMLKYLELPISKGLFVHGHILSAGKKMSKTIGNVIGIEEMLEKFGTDGTRYLLLSAGHFGEDIDVTMERLKEKYNADLANGLGNLVSRIVTLASKSKVKSQKSKVSTQVDIFDKEFVKLVEGFEFDKALEYIWQIVRESNKFIEKTKPWELAKQVESRKNKVENMKRKAPDEKEENGNKEFEKVMEKLVGDLYFIRKLLQPFLPETAEKIKQQLETGKKEILFKRIK
jgi:methionyl-tRNA synthetase